MDKEQDTAAAAIARAGAMLTFMTTGSYEDCNSCLWSVVIGVKFLPTVVAGGSSVER